MNQRTEIVPLFPGIWSWKLPTQQSGQGRRLGCPRRSWASPEFCPQSPSAPASSWHCWWSAGSWPPQGQDAPQPPRYPTSGPPNHCVRTNRKYLCNPHIINIVQTAMEGQKTYIISLKNDLQYIVFTLETVWSWPVWLWWRPQVCSEDWGAW